MLIIGADICSHCCFLCCVVVSAFMFVIGYDTCYFLCLLSLTGLVAVVSAH